LKNKKASIEWNMTTLGGLVIAALAGILIFNMVGLYLHPERLQSTILAKDVALELEALYATPYDMTYLHPVSLFERNVIVKDASVQVVAKEDGPSAKESASKLFSFHTYYFLSSELLTLPSPLTIDAYQVVLSKKGNNLLVHDGSATITATDDVVVGLEDISVAVVPVLTGTSNDNILSSIATGVRNALAQEKIPLVSEEQATLIIQLSFQSADGHSIYYSTINTEAVRPLATVMKQQLDILLSPRIGGSQSFTYSQAALDIALGLSHPDFATLQDANTRRILAQAMASSIVQTYPSAQKQLD
jgi:hypothetical protein